MRAALTGIALAAALVLVWTLITPAEYSRKPVLADVVDGGKMEEFLETDEERDAILSWVAAGAPERAWGEVAPILAARCTTCHHSSASFEMLRLDAYEPAAKSARVRPLLVEKVTGGTMGKYLETESAHHSLVSWIERGSPESEWSEIERILDAYCVQCHHPEGVQGIVALTSYRAVSRLAMPPTAMPRQVWPPIIVIALAATGRLLSRRSGRD